MRTHDLARGSNGMLTEDDVLRCLRSGAALGYVEHVRPTWYRITDEGKRYIDSFDGGAS
jgi:hypothetical protein